MGTARAGRCWTGGAHVPVAWELSGVGAGVLGEAGVGGEAGKAGLGARGEGAGGPGELVGSVVGWSGLPRGRGVRGSGELSGSVGELAGPAGDPRRGGG